jgi:hypothetical protein
MWGIGDDNFGRGDGKSGKIAGNAGISPGLVLGTMFKAA